VFRASILWADGVGRADPLEAREFVILSCSLIIQALQSFAPALVLKGRRIPKKCMKPSLCIAKKKQVVMYSLSFSPLEGCGQLRRLDFCELTISNS
jgi:hypothetical protein